MGYNLKFEKEGLIEIELATRGQARNVVEALEKIGVECEVSVEKIVKFKKAIDTKTAPKNVKKDKPKKPKKKKKETAPATAS